MRPLDSFIFVPLVTAETDAVAELTVTILRPEPPGGLITQGGDIDNRMKTLFDAITMPRHQNALPKDAAPSTEEEPFFFCVLEDDNLITALTLKTEQLLEPNVDAALVELTLQFTTRVTRHTMSNGAFT